MVKKETSPIAVIFITIGAMIFFAIFRGVFHSSKEFKCDIPLVKNESKAVMWEETYRKVVEELELQEGEEIYLEKWGDSRKPISYEGSYLSGSSLSVEKHSDEDFYFDFQIRCQLLKKERDGRFTRFYWVMSQNKIFIKKICPSKDYWFKSPKIKMNTKAVRENNITLKEFFYALSCIDIENFKKKLTEEINEHGNAHASLDLFDIIIGEYERNFFNEITKEYNINKIVVLHDGNEYKASDEKFLYGKYLVFHITLAHGEKRELYMYKIGSLMEVGK